MLDFTKDTESKFKEVITSFEESLKSIQTGRAHPGLVEDIRVNHYNSLLPLKQLASITAPSPQEIIIRPWDQGALQPIETALREAGRNFNPVSDGTTLRIVLAPMSGERRQELERLVAKQAEQAKVALRNIREETWREVVKAQRQSQITEDDRYRLEKDLNQLISDYNKKIADLQRLRQQAIET